MPWTWLVAKWLTHLTIFDTVENCFVGGFTMSEGVVHSSNKIFHLQARQVAEHQTVKPWAITTMLLTSKRSSWYGAMPTGIHLMFRYICTSLICLASLIPRPSPFFAFWFVFSIIHASRSAAKYGKARPGNTYYVNDVRWTWGERGYPLLH